MSSPLIRAMANTLVDHDVDPLDAMAVIRRLKLAGFSAKQIVENYDAVECMATTRRHHERKANEREGKRGRLW
jgi:hypothetical protein